MKWCDALADAALERVDSGILRAKLRGPVGRALRAAHSAGMMDGLEAAARRMEQAGILSRAEDIRALSPM